MQKVVAFLESNVQWVIIGLGVLYLGFMAWTFVIQSPVQLNVANETVGPGDVDRMIVEKPVSTLGGQISRPPPPGGFPKITWSEDFKTAMELNRTKNVELAGKPWVNIPVLVTPGNFGGGGAEIVAGGAAQPIAQLPTVPAAIMGPVGNGASSVITPAAPGGVDKNWAVATFKIPNREIAAAFSAVKLPKILYSTAVLEVKLMRQEQKSDGSWGNAVEIARLPHQAVLPLPPKNEAVDKLKQFLQWAGLNQKQILQPEFYQIAKGDPVTIPTADAPVAVVPAAPAQEGLPDFDPARTEYTPEEIKQMTPEQKRQWQKALKEKQDKERKEKAGQRGGGRGRGGKGGGAAGGGASGGLVDDGGAPVEEMPGDVIDPFAPQSGILEKLLPTYQRQQQPGGRGGTPGGTPGGVPYPGQPPYGGQPGGQPQPQDGEGNPNQPAAPTEHPFPTSIFDPSESPEHWDGWAFDDTVQAGKTYRYRVIYSIKSPVFNSPNSVQDKAMANQLAIASVDGEWSKDVKIAARTSFYISSNFADKASSVKFQVFAWQGGAKREKTFEVQPGDMIGAIEGDVDYRTGATLVDIGYDSRTERTYALVADGNGTLMRRDFNTDKANPEWENDKRAVAAGAAPPPTPGVAENR